MVSVTPTARTLALATPSPSSRPPAVPATGPQESPQASKAPSSRSSAHAQAPPRTLTELLAFQPASSPARIRKSSKYLPRPSWPSRLWVRFISDGGKRVERKRGQRSEEAIQRERDLVRACGEWGDTQPGDLFLDIYGSVLQTLNHDPRAGLCSPSLLGSSGTLPLTILSLIPDIMSHYASIIRRAQHEVLLFTNYWQPSDSQKTICDALRALSDRVGREGTGKKIVVKLVYDRGTFQQLLQNHAPVPPEAWHEIDLPEQDEIPNLDMQVINYHRPLVGTFHSKFLVVDREVGLLNSNNIQDRPNLEMMVHLEGPIVQALYDTALISFANKMTPPPPLLATPPSTASAGFQDANKWLGDIPLTRAAEAIRRLLQTGRPDHKQKQPGRMKDIVRTMIEKGAEEPAKPREPTWFDEMTESLQAGVASRMGSRTASRRTSYDAGASHPSGHVQTHSHPVALPHASHPGFRLAPVPAADVPSNSSLESQVSPSGHPSNSPLPTPPESPSLHKPAAFGGLGADFFQDHKREGTGVTLVDEPELMESFPHGSEPTMVAEESHNAAMVVQKDFGKMDPLSSEPKDEALGRLAMLSKRLNPGVLSEPVATVDDTDAIDQFMSHILHSQHTRIPMVLVNRKPRGMFGHQDLRTPQNAAWLAGFKFAKHRVFIQTPTWNARPAVDAAIDACRRGVEVILYLGLGFNDKGESIPFQGGTNEEVIVRMYKRLKKTGSSRFLKVFWYVAKDQSRPLNAVFKQRNCHVKLAIFDDTVGMAGNGNQDTQSWYHSQEVNVLIDSAQICADWIQAITHNQNTHIYGLVDDDGVWRNPEGRTWQELDRLKERALAQKEESELVRGRSK